MSKHVLAVGFITPTTRELRTKHGMALAPRHEHALVEEEWSKDMKLTHDQLSQLAALAADAREAADYGDSNDAEHEAMTDLLDAVESLLSRAELAEDALWKQLPTPTNIEAMQAHFITDHLINSNSDLLLGGSFDALEACHRDIHDDEQMDGEEGHQHRKDAPDPWEDNEVQFSRLLAEISATQDKLDLEALAESMDLEVAQVNELFDRAQVRWEEAK
jgi:hypothetical protein